MKRLNFLLISFVLLSVFCFRADMAFAFEFNFYYQSIEKVFDPADTAQLSVGDLKDPSVEIKYSNYTAPDGSADANHAKIAYKVRTTKVTDLDGLLNQMGVSKEDYENGKLTNGQKALVATFEKAKDQAVTDRTRFAYKDHCDVILVDSTDYDYDSKVSSYVKSAIQKDFWPCSSSSTNSIRMSSSYFKNTTNPDTAPSTFVHEYSHSLDKSKFQESNPYGKDGKHSADEITTKSAAFKEAWAEYNEMIEYDFRRDYFLNYCKPSTMLKIESGNGDYSTKIKASDASASTLLRNEAFMASMLYKLHEVVKTDRFGNDQVSMAFYKTNGETNDMSQVVKQLIKDNPWAVTDIIKAVDEATLYSMTDDELIDFVGKSDELEEYLKTRSKDSEKTTSTEVSTSTGTSTSTDKGTVGEGAARRPKTTEVTKETTKKPGIFQKIIGWFKKVFHIGDKKEVKEDNDDNDNEVIINEKLENSEEDDNSESIGITIKGSRKSFGE